MSQLRYLSAGESHGKGIMAILEGLPKGLEVDFAFVKHELKRRQSGYGRGGRMAIETDEAEFIAGVRGGILTGAPIGIFIANRDHESFKDIVSATAKNTHERVLTRVRPAHADLAGCIKYNTLDARNILERASARETAAKVAVGALCKLFLRELGIFVASHVTNIGGNISKFDPKTAKEILDEGLDYDLNCKDESCRIAMKKSIDLATANGDTLGGEITLLADNMPVGVGSHIQFDKRLDYVLSGLLGAIPAVKSVSFGDGVKLASLSGSQAHDEIDKNCDGNSFKFVRKTNHAGGVEGGMTNGETVKINLCVKPIPTLKKGLNTIDIKTGERAKSASERSDVCAVPAAAVVAESVLAFGLAQAILECVGGDFLEETKERVDKKRAREGLGLR